MSVPEKVDDNGRRDFSERLRRTLKAAGGNGAVAKRAGVPESTLNKWLAGAEPGVFSLRRIAEAARSSIDYLAGSSSFSGTAVEVTQAWPVPSAVEVAAGVQPADHYVTVPRLEVRASAGPGRAVSPFDLDRQASVAFQERWLRTLGVTASSAELLLAQGDSMEPTIRDGDLMLVDRGYGDVVSGKIYVLVVDGLVLVKRLHKLAAGGLMLISDNERYPPETISRADADGLSIEARVAWYGRAI